MATVHIAIGSMYTNAKVRNWQSYGFVIDIGMIQERVNLRFRNTLPYHKSNTAFLLQILNRDS